MSNPHFVAGGNIRPCRFVTPDPTADNYPSVGSCIVKEGEANDDTIGISMESTDYPPLNDSHVTVGGYAAILGESFEVHSTGECLLELGDTVANGGRVKSDGDGKGVPIATTGTTIQYAGARALQSGVSGDKIRVQVERMAIRPDLT